MNSNFRAFTLVELIVVITILAILGTVGFLSFTGYQVSARDSIRISDINLLERQLSYYSVENSSFPSPDNSIELTASGTTFGYQGEVGTGVLMSLKQGGEINDPLDRENYTYVINNAKNSTQILAFMEKSSSLNAGVFNIGKTHAEIVNPLSRFPKTFGFALGVLTTQGNIPLEKVGGINTIDVIHYDGEPYKVHYNDEETSSGTGMVLSEMIVNANCKRVRQMGAKENGVYTINPLLSGEFDVYCDMNARSGGWNLVARSLEGSSGDFGWLVSRGSPGDDSQPYSLGNNIINLDFAEILLATYDDEKNIVMSAAATVDKSFLKEHIGLGDSAIARTSQCVTKSSSQGVINDICDTDIYNKNGLLYIGNFGAIDGYYFSYRNNAAQFGEGLDASRIHGLHKGSFSNQAGMIFVR